MADVADDASAETVAQGGASQDDLQPADWSTDALDAAGWEGLLARADDVFGRALTRRPHDVVAAAADANKMIDDLMEVTGEFHADARSLLARIMHRYGSVLRGAACAGSEPCAAAAAAVSEDSESDTEDEQRAPLKIERVPCGQGGLLSIMTLRLAPSSGKGVARSSKYVFLRELEHFCDGTSGRSTSRLAKKIAGSNLGGSLRVLEAKTARQNGLSVPEFRDLLDAYMTGQRSRDSLCTTARRFTLVPHRVAVMVAQDERKPAILTALGRKVPPKWIAEQKRRADARDGAVDYANEAVLEDEDCDELAEIALQTELLTDYTSFEPKEADEVDARTYCLRNPSAALRREVELFKSHRQKAICRFRTGAAVLNTTVSADISTLMRLLGWMKGHRPRDENETATPLTMAGVITSPQLGRWVEQYIEWLGQRKCSHVTIANYVNSIVTLKAYTLSDAFHGTDESEQAYDELVRMRQQAHALAKQDQLWRAQNPEWLSWPQVMATRLQCEAAYKSVKGLQKRLVALRTLMVITAHSILPPDRVGTIRLLRIGHTLKLLDGEEGGEARYWIDYRSRSNRHKTSRFYGASMTLLPPQMDSVIKDWVSLKAKLGKYDLESNGLHGQYLFTSTEDGSRPYPTSSWTKVVKDAFRLHSPGNKAPAPKTLRSIFVTWMRQQCENDADMKQVLKSAAHAMKHRETTSESCVYDKATHQKLTAASYEFTLRFARECEAAYARGEDIPTAASGTRLGPSNASSGSRDGTDGPRAPPSTPTRPSRPTQATPKKKGAEGDARTNRELSEGGGGDAAAASSEPAPSATRPAPALGMVGANVAVYFGDSAGWCTGVVRGRYDPKSKVHWLVDFEGASDWPCESKECWQVDFDDGDKMSVALSGARRAPSDTPSRPRDGDWRLLK